MGIRTGVKKNSCKNKADMHTAHEVKTPTHYLSRSNILYFELQIRCFAAVHKAFSELHGNKSPNEAHRCASLHCLP